jgi:hypothetical protein
MTQYLFSPRSFGLSGTLAVLLAGLTASPALAKQAAPLSPTPVDTSACSSPHLVQPFLAANDTNWYTLAPGQTADNFAGGGWTLSGGAQIITTRLANGQTGLVLDLRSGSQAVSPVMCVTSAYPTARTMVYGATKKGITFSVAYAGTSSWGNAIKTGNIQASNSGWSLSDPFSLQPGALPGWQLVQFTLTGDKKNDTQISNLYIDPRMKA